jgi:hypothetical protein
MEKWLILWAKEKKKKYTMSLGHLLVNRKHSKYDGNVSKGHRSQTDKIPKGQIVII